MSKQITKRQHVVPQFYLKSFAVQTKLDNFKIFCYFKQQKNKIERLEVKDVAVKKFFYDENKLPQPIESYLSFTEKDLSRTYHKIIKEKSINNLNEKERKYRMLELDSLCISYRWIYLFCHRAHSPGTMAY